MISKLLLTFILSSQIFLPASSNDGQVLGVQTQRENNIAGPERIVNQSLNVVISADSALVVDLSSGKILYQKNQNKQRPIASITKLMTMLVFLDTNPDFDKITRYAWVDWTGGERVEFKTNEEVTIKDLFYSSLIASTNNTVKTLVRSTGMGERQFVIKMNEKAKELGMTDTKFTGITGLSEFNISTTRDIVTLLKTVMNKKEITEVLSKDEYVFTTNLSQHRVDSTNLLLNNKYFNIEFGKTGYIEEAGWCFASLGKVKDNNILTVVLGSKSQYSRFQDTKALYWWINQNYNF
jgi:serine-type D-Ala-D-Ala endopeptidase (penicillin-binding protein 7)